MTSRSTTLALGHAPGSPAVRTSWTAALATVVAIAMAAEAAATSWRHIPLRDAVREVDVIVRGEITAREPLDEQHEVLVVQVAAVLKDGDSHWEENASIRLITQRATPVGAREFKEGDDGIWLVQKVKDSDAYRLSLHPVYFHPAAAAPVIELLVAGKTDAGEAMPQILREADGRARQLALWEVCGPQARAAALPLLLEWAGAPRERDAEIGTNVRGLAIHELVKACDDDGRGVPPQAMQVLDGVLAREPEKTESAWVFAQACNAASAIAKKHFGFEQAGAGGQFAAQDFYPAELRYFANPEAMQAAAPRREKARAAVKTLRAWWAERPSDRP
jgi:hypothetical protein